jgi:hypothetical protein
MEILKWLREAVCREKPEVCTSNCILHHDNAPVHEVPSAKQFMAQKSITEMEHPPIPLILAPNDFCFQK